MKFDRKLFKEAFKAGYKKAKLNEAVKKSFDFRDNLYTTAKKFLEKNGYDSSQGNVIKYVLFVYLKNHLTELRTVKTNSLFTNAVLFGLGLFLRDFSNTRFDSDRIPMDENPYWAEFVISHSYDAKSLTWRDINDQVEELFDGKNGGWTNDVDAIVQQAFDRSLSGIIASAMYDSIQEYEGTSIEDYDYKKFPTIKKIWATPLTTKLPY